MNKKTIRKNLIAFGLIASVLIFLPSVVTAYEWDGEDREEMWQKKMETMKETLELTDEQCKAICDYHERRYEEGKAVREAVREKRSLMHEELSKESFDEVKVRAIHSEITELRNQKDTQRLEAIINVRKTLTPEQFRKMQAMHQERKESWKQKRLTQFKDENQTKEP